MLKKNLLFCSIALLLGLYCSKAFAQNGAADTIDALHYDLKLDIGNKTHKRIEGSAAVTLRILQPVDSIGLELGTSNIDSVWVNGIVSNYSYRAPLLQIPYSGNGGDTVTITIFYRKGQQIMPQGWGGFYFDDEIYYNLGIAIYQYPHNVGKAWFPCRDNFTDKATYHFSITAPRGWKAICTGMQDSVTTDSSGVETYHWTLARQTPTYLVGVAVAPFNTIERTFDGIENSYPGLLGFIGHDSLNVWNTFEHMEAVIPFYESCFGPYMWDRVGYLSTPLGSMEHVGNVAFVSACMSSQEEACLTTMAHEFSHSWFGNLTTCTTSEDMWINEGGASFCEELAVQAICPEGDSMRYKAFADENLNSVLCSSHVRDDGFKAVYGNSPDYTYGHTVYRKGATVWHSLRGYIGDSLFYASMRKLFDRCAFGNIDSYQLRDSLSAYCGLNLTDFFNFHVFGPGFNDYIIDSLKSDNDITTISMHQGNYGTTNFMNSNRVWVTFFSAQLDTTSRLITFDGQQCTKNLDLPFRPIFAIADYDKRLSKASIGSQLSLDSRGTFEMPESHFNATVSAISDNDSGWIYITHHWCRPDSAKANGFAKMADRYWEVNGLIPSSTRVNGRFHYCRTGLSAGSLDNDLYSGPDEFSQVRLLYRANNKEPWRSLTSMHTGSSAEGYFVANNLKPGQYTLGVKDTSHVGIDSRENSQQWSPKVFPNPTTGMITVETDIPGENLVIDIYDASGRTALKTLNAKSCEPFNTALAAGTYFFNIVSKNDNNIRSAKIKIMIF